MVLRFLLCKFCRKLISQLPAIGAALTVRKHEIGNQEFAIAFEAVRILGVSEQLGREGA